MLSRAFEEDMGTTPISWPMSILLEGTSLDPLRDESLRDWQLVSNEEGDLRNPIAPPLISLRMVMVISFVGTSKPWSSEETSDTLTVKMSDTLTLKPSDRVMSETPAERTSEILTLPNLTPPPVSREEF